MLWAPLVDSMLDLGRWHVLGTAAALSLVPARVGQRALPGGLVVSMEVAPSVVSMAFDELTARCRA